jgi:hypothetical protein
MMLLRKLKLNLFNASLLVSVLLNGFLYFNNRHVTQPGSTGLLPGVTPSPPHSNLVTRRPSPPELAKPAALAKSDDDDNAQVPDFMRFLELSARQKRAIREHGGFDQLQSRLAANSAEKVRQADDDDQAGVVAHKAAPKAVAKMAVKDGFNPPGCTAQTKIVYVKTHKTGSSTLTNIFHRYAEKHHLKVVLPKGNTFLGWPRSAGIPTSYVQLPNSEGNYDVFCSAHTRYNHDYIADIVPNGNHITILRDPLSHFLSSWSYWGVASHVKRVSGFDVTWQEFLEDPQLWFSRSLKGDRDLLHNSVAFDFGYEHEYEESDAATLIKHLDTFTQVGPWFWARRAV